MYRNCLFCYRDLGQNETLELLPVGRRVAFDGSRARLWVVCRACSQWNLSPLEDRWEVVEQAERAFANATVRAATENIALARAADGTDLIRIGRSERMEFATWRYGGRFRIRRAKQYTYVGVAGAAVATVVGLGGIPLLAAIPGGALALAAPAWTMFALDRFGVVARVEAGSKKPARVRPVHLHAARLENDGSGHRLIVRHNQGRSTLEGHEAVIMASRILARLNAKGASRRGLGDAMSYLGCSPTSVGAIEHVSRTLPGSLLSLPSHVRIALEIATQEESERRALEEELAELEAAWKEAEQLAAIADNLLVPSWITDRVSQLRRGD